MGLRHLFAVAFAALFAAGAAHASVEISTKATQNISCVSGVCTPTSDKAFLNATDLANMLATSDVKIVTGNGANTITVSAPFSWTSSSRLTLDAIYNVSFKAPVEVTGQGAVTIVYNDGGTGGDLIFFPGGKLDFWDLSSDLQVNGEAFELVSDVAALANAANANPSGDFALAEDTGGGPGRFSGIDKFLGKLNGLGHTISHLTAHRRALHIGANRESNTFGAGLIGYLNGEVSNLTLRSVSIVDKKPFRVGRYPEVFLGGIAAFADGASVVDNVYVTGTVGSVQTSQFAYAGGIIGEGGGTVSRSHADVKVGCIEICGDGALMGFNEGSVFLSSGHGTVTCESACTAGGLLGVNTGPVDQSYSDATVTANYYAGDRPYAYASALIGDQNGKVSNSYASGNAAGTTCAAGFAGIENGGTGSSVYSTAKVGSTNSVGGLVGIDNSGTATNMYWDLDTSGVSDPSKGAGNIKNDPGMTGLTDVQLKSNLPAGFDPTIWAIKKNANNGYPYLIANPPPQ